MNRDEGILAFQEVSGILDACGIDFFLIQGTALGSYRDGGFTPTEEDIDFGVLIEDLVPNVLKLIGRLVNAQYEVHALSAPFSRCRMIVAEKGTVHVDIGGFLRWEDKRFVTRPRDRRRLEPYSIVHPASMLENYDSVELFGRQCKVPSPIEEYLTREYGDWKTPRKDHVSRTRIYNFVDGNKIPHDHISHLKYRPVAE